MQLYVKTVVPALTVLIPAAYFTLVSVCGQNTLMDVAAETLLFWAMAPMARHAIAATDLNILDGWEFELMFE